MYIRYVPVVFIRLFHLSVMSVYSYQSIFLQLHVVFGRAMVKSGTVALTAWKGKTLLMINEVSQRNVAHHISPCIILCRLAAITVDGHLMMKCL